jgi:hypothetical protein
MNDQLEAELRAARAEVERLGAQLVAGGTAG